MPKELKSNKELQKAFEFCKEIKKTCDENYHLLVFRRRYVKMKNASIEDKIKLIEEFGLDYKTGFDLLEFIDVLSKAHEKYMRENNF